MNKKQEAAYDKLIRAAAKQKARRLAGLAESREENKHRAANDKFAADLRRSIAKASAGTLGAALK